MERSSSLTGPIRDGWLHALSFVSCVSMFTAPWFVENGYQVAAIGVVGTLLFWPLARRGTGLRAWGALTGTLIPQLIFVTLMALVTLAHPIVLTRGESYGVTAAGFFVYALAFLVAVYVGAVIPDDLRRARRGTTTPKRALAVVAALSIVCVAAVRREHLAPPVGAYITRLPVLGTIPRIECAQAEVEQVFVHAAGSVRVMRRCTSGRPDMASLVLDHPSPLPAERRQTWRAGYFGATVRYDSHTDAVVFESTGWPYAFRRTSGEVLNLSRGDLAPWHAPPRGWATSSIVGLVIALGLLAWPRRVPVSLLRWRAAREGSLAHDDTITFPNGAPFVRLPKGHGLAPGSVLVLDEPTGIARGESATGSPFRDATGREPDAVVQGTLRDVLDSIEAFEQGPTGLAVMVAVTTSMPLLVAALRGAVF